MSPVGKTVSYDKARIWEEKMKKKGFVRHLHPNFHEFHGWYLWVKKGSNSYSIVWEDQLNRYAKIYNLPEEHTCYWTMTKDLSYLFEM
jgi:hypothetical protein